MTVRTNAERQREFRKRKLDQGLVLVKLWLEPDQAEALKQGVRTNEAALTSAVSPNAEVEALQERTNLLAGEVRSLRSDNADLARRLEAAEAEAKRLRSGRGALSEKEWGVLVYVCHPDTWNLATAAQRGIAAGLLAERKPLLVVKGKGPQTAD